MNTQMSWRGLKSYPAHNNAINSDVQKRRFVDANFLYDLLMHYDLAYCNHVERIMHLAQELRLTFSGKLDEAIKSFVEGIIE